MKETIQPKITLNRAGCPELVPDEFNAEINCSRYGIAMYALVQIRFRDNDTQKSTPYCVCRVTDLKSMPNYMDGKRTRVTFVKVKEGGSK